MPDSDSLSSVSHSLSLPSSASGISSFISRFAKPKASHSHGPSLPEGLTRRFSLAEIKAATGDFARRSLIGDGGFSCIYKGVILIDDASLPVIVKRFTSTRNRTYEEEFFRTEVLILCQLRHPHIINLIGFCWEDGEQILVYENMSNGGLYRHLFNPNQQLHWKRRLEICIAAARGLHYLHTGLKRVVIHRDVKTSNILIDDHWGAKLSGFNLCQLGPSTVSSTAKPLVFNKDTEVIIGTFGYMAPEYAMDGEMSTKSDVFAFGVVLLEVLSGRPVTAGFGHDETTNLICWCGQNMENKTVYEILDPCLRWKVATKSLKIFLEIADSCLAMEADERPMIGEVEMSLELALELQNKADSEILESTDNEHNSAEFYYNYELVTSHLPPESSNLVKWNRSSGSQTSDQEEIDRM